MSDVRVTGPRRRLGQHLRNVQGGECIKVWHRKTPIARIVPYEEEGASLKVQYPLPGALSFKQISLPPTLKLRRDIVMLLLEERQGER